MDLNLKGKRVLVTGGSRGIGKSIAEEFSKEGCLVDICSRTEGIIIDVLKDDFGKIDGKYDVLINNVGGGGRWGSENYEEFEEWEEVYEKNAGVARKLTMKCLPYMKEKKWGRVVTISSIFGKEAGGQPWFNMAKAAEISLMKNLAGKYRGVTFNSIAPGHIDIGNKDYIGEGSPVDVANIVIFLCSNKAKHINGSCITVDGGFSRSF
jgi:3-oxoacyl-[acyl-carrier protein] reductase